MDPSTVAPAVAAGTAQEASQSTPNGAATAAPASAASTAAVITPLAVPWLHHDGFPTVKKVCSESGLPQAKKTSVVRVLQELKKGRNRIDQQLAQLETQLLHVSDFLSGATPTLEIATDEASAVADDEATASVNGETDGDASHNGQRHGEGDKSAPIDPVATLVEEDLAAETPCTTVGLWRFLSVFPFFKTVTLEDMQEALLLEDPALVVPPEANGTHDAESVDTLSAAVNGLRPLDEGPMQYANGKGNEDASSSLHQELRMRLLAALLPEDSVKQKTGPLDGHIQEDAKMTEAESVHSSVHVKDDDVKMTGAENGHHSEHAQEGDVSVAKAQNGHHSERTKENDVSMTEAQHGDGDVDMMPVDDTLLLSTETRRASTRTLQQLRDIGLVEATNEELAQHLTTRQDDEVSCEIRMLQSELVRQVRRNNEVKRTLRRSLERLKPWLTHDEEYQQIETKFQKMWHRKKELQRKKKHKEKKLQRKEASYKSAFLMPPQPPVPS